MLRALVALAALLAVAGCSGGGSDTTSEASPQAVVAATPAKTAAATPASVEITGTVTPANGAGSEVKIEGTVDGATGNMTLTSTEGGSDATTKVAHDGTVFYVQPVAGTEIPQGKEWVRIDIAEFSPGTQDLSGFLQFLQSDPMRLLGFVAAGMENPKDVNTEDVHGVETTHYRGTVNVEQAAEASTDLGDAFTQLAELADFTEFTADIWIDGDGVTRQLIYEIPNSAIAGGGTARTAIVFTEFGEDIEVEVPSDDDAYDLGQPALPPTDTGEEPR